MECDLLAAWCIHSVPRRESEPSRERALPTRVAGDRVHSFGLPFVSLATSVKTHFSTARARPPPTIQ
jgi:hypothetical protein